MRLIDADALNFDGMSITQIVDAVQDAPTIDAAPAVRCKNCKHYQIDVLFKRNYCCGRLRKPDDYCSYGEQKEDKQ